MTTTLADPLAIAKQFAAHPDDWPLAPRFDPARRWYHRLSSDDGHEVWLLTWLPGQSTEWHDHGGSAGAFVIVTGELTEQVYPGDRSTFAAGQGRSFAAQHIHRIANQGTRPAVSIHVYEPAISAMTRYQMEGESLTVAGIDRAGAQW